MTADEVAFLLIAVFAAAAAATWLAPALLSPLWRLLLHAVYRFRVHNAGRIPAAGPALIVCNHLTYLDWMVLWAACPRRVRFVLWNGYYQNPVLAFFLSWARHRTVRIDNRTTRPHALADGLGEVTDALGRGEAVVVFPEGRLTRNGQMRPFGRGIERVLKQTGVDVPVIPACVSGLWGSVFSHKDGRILRRLPSDFRRKVSVWFGEPVPKTGSAPEIRAAVVGAQADLAVRESDETVPVPRWYVRTASSWKNVFHPAFVDVATGNERRLSCGVGLVACWCLADWLRQRIAPSPPANPGGGGRGEGVSRYRDLPRDPPHPSHSPPANPGGGGVVPVGLWLPTGLGSTLANIALSFLRVTTVNLNYTAGRDAVTSAVRQVGMRFVITAKLFEKRVPLELPADIERIYLDDALAAIPKSRKILRFLAVLAFPSWLLERLTGAYRSRPDDVLTIVFSSGSTGEPKGVMLSTRNISANSYGFYVGVDMRRTDRMIATLPFFHSFGYTVCLWSPAVVGMRAVYYPDPRAAKEVGDLCRKHRGTIMLGTATFLRFYLRRSGPDDFKSLRLLICGAEKLPVKLAKEFESKFGVLPLEGYGCTETSPVVCTNLHDVDVRGVIQVANRLGTVGQPIPGVVAKAFDPDNLSPLPPGVEGVLGVKGPNVMLGYFGQPERTAKAIVNGWYVTGDMGLIEPDGFIRITGRLSRFAKIAGEMIPLERLEEEMQDLLGTGERMVAVFPVSDERRGERLVVLYLPEVESKLDAVLKELPKRGLPNLWVPDRRDCYAVDAFPVLGSGKMDLCAAAALAEMMPRG
jgi:acyl-[acyl-carrier-protein]-phospholipid O-acyltransferase/long-chain-fatty-acid--[acyl-carrier-protein] ligase